MLSNNIGLGFTNIAQEKDSTRMSTIKGTIHLADGATVETEVNGRSLDGTQGSAWLPPPGPREEHFSWGDWLQAGRVVDIHLVNGQWTEKE